MQYLDEDNKKIEIFFKDFKNIFSTVINLYIDEKISFASYRTQALTILYYRYLVNKINILFWLLKSKTKLWGLHRIRIRYTALVFAKKPQKKSDGIPICFRKRKDTELCRDCFNFYRSTWQDRERGKLDNDN